MRTIKTGLLLVLSTLFLSACITPYQPDVQQGNIINNSDLREINKGMSKQEVLFILGTPMIIDPFNKQRWDYFYSRLDQQKKQTDNRIITAIFEGDKLVNILGDATFANIQNLEASAEDRQHGGTIITKPTQQEKGLLNRLGIIKPKNVITQKSKK